MGKDTVALAVGMTVAEPRQQPVLHCTPQSLAVCDARGCWAEFTGTLSYIVNLQRRVVSRCVDIETQDCELSPVASVTPDGPGALVLAYETTTLRLAKRAEFVLTAMFSFEDDGRPGAEVAFGTCAPFGARAAAE